MERKKDNTKTIEDLQYEDAIEIALMDKRNVTCQTCLGFCFGNSVCHNIDSLFCGKTVHYAFSCSKWKEIK